MLRIVIIVVALVEVTGVLFLFAQALAEASDIPGRSMGIAQVFALIAAVLFGLTGGPALALAIGRRNLKLAMGLVLVPVILVAVLYVVETNRL